MTVYTAYDRLVAQFMNLGYSRPEAIDMALARICEQ